MSQKVLYSHYTAWFAQLCIYKLPFASSNYDAQGHREFAKTAEKSVEYNGEIHSKSEKSK